MSGASLLPPSLRQHAFISVEGIGRGHADLEPHWLCPSSNRSGSDIDALNPIFLRPFVFYSDAYNISE